MAVSSPRPKGPPLNALRAFEAAARLGSFSAAGHELCVTPGAVAQHIKSVEAWAGGRLFVRRAQGVALTALGAGILPAFVTAFDHLGEAVQPALQGGGVVFDADKVAAASERWQTFLDKVAGWIPEGHTSFVVWRDTEPPRRFRCFLPEFEC